MSIRTKRQHSTSTYLFVEEAVEHSATHKNNLKSTNQSGFGRGAGKTN